VILGIKPVESTARPGSHIDAPQDRATAEAPDDPPDDPSVHLSADTRARRVRNGSKRTPGYKMKSNGPDEESFIDRGPYPTPANRDALRGHHL